MGAKHFIHSTVRTEITSLSEWEETYLAGKQIMKWPSSDLVSLVRRHQHFLEESSKKNKLKILELGFGTGPNINFFKSLGAEFYGVELSQTAVTIAKETFPELSTTLINGSFENLEKFPKNFDIIYDRASVTHGSTDEIEQTLHEALHHLKKGGFYIGVEWFSSNHSDFILPSTRIDARTRDKFTAGQFVGVGKVHFSSRVDMLDLFREFEILELKEKQVISHHPDQNSHCVATWNIVAKKPF
jgi:SAM-dependent methyltransferase